MKQLSVITVLNAPPDITLKAEPNVITGPSDIMSTFPTIVPSPNTERTGPIGNDVARVFAIRIVLFGKIERNPTMLTHILFVMFGTTGITDFIAILVTTVTGSNTTLMCMIERTATMTLKHTILP